MDIIDNLEDEVIESVEMQRNCPPSTKIISLVGFLLATVSLILTGIFEITYIVDVKLAAYLSERLFFPALVIGIFALIMTVSERLRGKYLLIKLSVWFAAVAVFALILFLIIQFALTGMVRVLPISG